MSKSKIILITGATAGIGRITALHLAKLGHHVLASGRKPAELAKLRNEASGKLDTLLLDVTSPVSIAAATAEVDRLTDGHGLDVLINNAGFGKLGPTAETTDAEMRAQYETNVFGLMNVTRAFLPKMVERRAGRVINVASVGGRTVMPWFGVYNSTKYAVEALSDAMRYELRAFNIDVVLIEPGVTRTNFEATAADSLQQFAHTPYQAAIAQYDELAGLVNKFASDPIVVAKAIARAVDVRWPAARYVTPALNNLMIVAARVLPTRVWDWTMRKVGRLDAKALGLTSVPPRPAPARTSGTPVETRVSNN